MKNLNAKGEKAFDRFRLSQRTAENIQFVALRFFAPAPRYSAVKI
jgi:hypothetical protein